MKGKPGAAVLIVAAYAAAMLVFNAVSLSPESSGWLVAGAAAAAIGASVLLGYAIHSAWALLPVGGFVALSVVFTPFFYLEVVDGPPDGQIPLVSIFLGIYSAALVGVGIGARVLADYVRRVRRGQHHMRR